MNRTLSEKRIHGNAKEGTSLSTKKTVVFGHSLVAGFYQTDENLMTT
ncbi:hypothetical protein [Dyadobacter sp. LHD-138]|nr:hypothetical protein [Dyadobacter sp. LHD-138]MDQ6482135.1 hypothetical protein [Dyadobacter sp. LHD-138]